MVANVIVTVLVLAVIVGLWIILYDSNRFVIVSHKIGHKNVKTDVKAVIISDLHNKQYGKENEKLIKAIKDQAPDLIICAGDIMTAKPGKTVDIATGFIKKINEIAPVYYGMGNHEYRAGIYLDKYKDMYEKLISGLNEGNVSPLINEKREFKDTGINIYGLQIDREYYKRFNCPEMEKEYIEGLLGTPEGEHFNILIAHNPFYFETYVEWGADLVLSGHVHGGVVRVPVWGKGFISPNLRIFPKYDGGVFIKGHTTMILSRGLGGHTIPFRMFNPGEVIVLEITGEREQ
ncbi:MAG: metallophosphoesterase [Lachnospiraceae bacterium]|nr:metallophosphoesterase [Lachnospiraceae bacterium]